MAQGSTEPLTEMSAKGVSWGVKATAAYGRQPYHFHVTTAWKFWASRIPGALRANSGLYRGSFNNDKKVRSCDKMHELKNTM
jgi:hypothetical protein